MVTLVDLGAGPVVPCQNDGPHIGKTGKSLSGQGGCACFHRFRKNPDEAKRFNLQVIPTQIFYDKNGNEVYRHMGFMEEKDIVAVLNKLGVN